MPYDPMYPDDAIDPESGRRPSEFHVPPGEPLLRRYANWRPPEDTSKLSVGALVEVIWNRPRHAVAPNGDTCPFVTTEEWTKIAKHFGIKMPGERGHRPGHAI